MNGNASKKIEPQGYEAKLIAQGWEEVSSEYSKDRTGVFGRSAERLSDLLKPQPGSSLLDVGCGSGLVTLRASVILGPGGSIVGTDIARSMLKVSLSTSLEKNLRINFSQMDAEWLGLAPNSFDFVTCAFSLFQFPGMENAIKEMRRVLKPGGRLGLANWGPGYFSPIASLQRDLFRKYSIKPLLSNPITFKTHVLEEMLVRSGFNSVENSEEIDEVWFPTPEEVWAYNMDMGPFPIMLRNQLSIQRQKELFNKFISMLESHKTERGIKATFHLIFTIAEKGY